MRLRVPGITDPFATRVWEFIDDTGASSMSLYSSDIEELGKAANVTIQAFGHERVSTANGRICGSAYHLQARLLANNNNTTLLIPWTDIKVLVIPGEPSDKMLRLSGIWPRHLLYFVDVPDNQGISHMSDKKSELVALLPDVDATQAIPPRWDELTPLSEDEMDVTQD